MLDDAGNAQAGLGVTRSVALTVTEMGPILLFGGQSCVWLGITLLIAGGVVSRTVIDTVSEAAAFPSSTVKVSVCVPSARATTGATPVATGEPPSVHA